MLDNKKWKFQILHTRKNVSLDGGKIDISFHLCYGRQGDKETVISENVRSTGRAPLIRQPLWQGTTSTRKILLYLSSSRKRPVLKKRVCVSQSVKGGFAQSYLFT